MTAEAYKPARYENHEAFAIKALAAGEATPEQQRTALSWIVQGAAGLDDLAWFPGGLEGDRATSFAAGRRFVGSQIYKLVNIRSDILEKPKDGETKAKAGSQAARR